MAVIAHADGLLLSDVADHIGTITLNNVAKHNALTPGMWEAMHDVLAAWADDADVRVVLLTGAGGKAFISGADISAFGTPRGDKDDWEARTRAWRVAVGRFPKPVVASIRGWCLGGGMAVAMQADIRIASDISRFGIPAGRLGLAYDLDMISQLVAVVGAAQARMLLFSADRIDAAEAARIGVVQKVVPDAELDGVVATLLARIAANAPLALAAMKIGMPAPAQGDPVAMGAAVKLCLASEDFAEGRLAFKEKREPAFRGK